MKYAVFAAVSVGLFGLVCVAHAAPAAAVEEAVLNANAARRSVVDVQAVWKNTPLLVRSVRFRPGKKIAVAYPSREDVSQCQGRLVQNNAVAQIKAACLVRPNQRDNRFELKRVAMDFANGNRFVFLPSEMRIAGEWAYFDVPAVITRGLGASKK